MKPEGWQRTTLRLVGDGERENGDASINSGLKSQGSTTSHKIQSHQLSVLLNELESNLDDLVFRYLEVLDTLIDVMARLVRLGAFTSVTTTTEEETSRVL